MVGPAGAELPQQWRPSTLHSRSTPFSALALGLGATILAHDGRTEQAISYAERAIGLNPRDPTIYLPLIGLAMAHSADGAFDQVLVDCRRAAQANPRFSVSFVLRLLPCHALDG